MDTKGKVLAIDDEEPIRVLYEKALKAEGYEVVVAKDGFEALSLLQEGDFDVVLMDLVMPALDGVEAITVMKSAFVDTPIIVVTGHVRGQAIEFARRAGACRVVHKPFRVAQLIDAIERAISHPDEIVIE